jgi:beta-fructofuranosidase
VTAEAAHAQAPARPRPKVHFTADDGWINDPYGVAWIDGRYHLYYQAIPGRVTWAPNCHWGHAVSEDLVHWVEQGLVLVPQDYEVGCWSGSVVDEAEPPTIFYTRVTGDDWEVGQVAAAVYDRAADSWRTTSDAVIEGPPPELGLRAFRDPNVFRRADDWAMLMAAALPDGSGAVLQYTSPDLRAWTYDGILCSRPHDRWDEVPTGALWECPQLFQLQDRWVLVISAWDEADLLYVAASVGDYDGHTFRPGPWQRLTHGSSAYAATAFVDRDGRRCLLSWLREEPRNNDALADRAGAHSVVSTLALRADGLLELQPHPDVDALRGPTLAGRPSPRGLVFDVGDNAVDVSVVVAAGAWCEVLEGDESRGVLSYHPERSTVVVARPDLPDAELPLSQPDLPVRVLVDADILEVFAPGSYGAYRIAPATNAEGTTITVSGEGAAEAAVHLLAGARPPEASRPEQT